MAEFITTSPAMSSVRRVASLDDHRDLLSHVFRTAKERILIVSPFISIAALKADDIAGMVRAAIRRGVSVTVFTDGQLNQDNNTGGLKDSARKGIACLVEAGAIVKVLSGIHNKTLIRDDDLITEGSFNWLSAVRSSGGIHQREERTVVVEHGETKKMIEEEIAMLTTMAGKKASVKSNKPVSSFWRNFFIYTAIVYLMGLGQCKPFSVDIIGYVTAWYVLAIIILGIGKMIGFDKKDKGESTTQVEFMDEMNPSTNSFTFEFGLQNIHSDMPGTFHSGQTNN